MNFLIKHTKLSNVAYSQSTGKLMLRFMIGGLMLFHGVNKIMEPSSFVNIQNLVNEMGIASFVAYGVFLGEVIAPIFVVIGVYCRIFSFIIFSNMLIAIYLVHANDLFAINQYGGYAIELQLLYMFGALVITLLGSGRYAFRPD